MRIVAKLDGYDAEKAKLNGARNAIRNGWAREAFAVGAGAVERVKRELLSGPTSETQTEVRSDQRRRSYAHRVTKQTDTIALDIGPIKPAAGGKIPIQSRVFEGFDAAGNKVTKFDIKAKNKPYLVFPIRRGPGLAKSNIIGWASKKSVTLYPRPTFPLVEQIVTPQLEEKCAAVFREAVG